MIKDFNSFKKCSQKADVLKDIIKQSKGCVRREDLEVLVKLPAFWETNYNVVTTKNCETFLKYLFTKESGKDTKRYMMVSLIGDLVPTCVATEEPIINPENFYYVTCMVNLIPTIVIYIPRTYDEQLDTDYTWVCCDINHIASETVYNYIRLKLGQGVCSKINFIKETSNPIVFEEYCRLQTTVNGSNKATQSTVYEELIKVLEVKPGGVIEEATDFVIGSINRVIESDIETQSIVESSFDVRKCYIFIKSKKTDIPKNDKYTSTTEVIVNYYKPNCFNYGLDSLQANLLGEYILKW